MLNKELLCHASGDAPTAVFELTPASYSGKDDSGIGYGDSYTWGGSYKEGILKPSNYKGLEIFSFGSRYGFDKKTPFEIKYFPSSEANKTGFAKRTDTGTTIKIKTEYAYNDMYTVIAEGNLDYESFLSTADVGKTITIEIYLK